MTAVTCDRKSQKRIGGAPSYQVHVAQLGVDELVEGLRGDVQLQLRQGHRARLNHLAQAAHEPGTRRVEAIRVAELNSQENVGRAPAAEVAQSRSVAIISKAQCQTDRADKANDWRSLACSDGVSQHSERTVGRYGLANFTDSKCETKESALQSGKRPHPGVKGHTQEKGETPHPKERIKDQIL